ncbi:MAG: ribosome biogenesis GTPase Der [Tissierellales bacterium]|nr:ribosome biogenesis GTPase Der [Tissierellales bacterium]MBN2827672.1 ribosome biogenesis GTPase Der [Tissierellales bacterium]
MGRPIVAIVGRPNVGKSTLFNRIAGKRISITEDTPGVTRDRIYAECEWLDKYFTLIDTGGIEPRSDNFILQQMKRQAEIAIETANVILFLVDGKNGITGNDKDVADLLRRSNKDIILVCNKMDKFVDEDNIYDFYELGIGAPYSISSTEALGLGDLLDEIISKFPEDCHTEYDPDVIKVAVIGKPNVGKSSLINKILGQERVIVSDIPGTTRDAVDTFFESLDNKFVFIDTAGIRKKKKIFENIERYSVVRSFTAVERADICLLVLDVKEGVTEQDTKIIGYAHENGKGIIVLVNKWDLIEKDNKTYQKYLDEVRNKLPFMTYAPIIPISALSGQRVPKILEEIIEINNFRHLRITTGVLNDVISEAILMNQPRSVKGKRLKIYYASQVSVSPPKFLLFVNDKELIHFSYVRYIENTIREHFLFKGTPIIIELRNKSK